MPPVKKIFKRKMTVVGQTVLHTWDNGKGGESNLWRVEAVNEKGEPITEQLRSFAELELNIPYDYEVEPYDHPTEGRTYTVKKPRANTAKRVGELEERLTNALERLSLVERKLGLAPDLE